MFDLSFYSRFTIPFFFTQIQGVKSLSGLRGNLFSTWQLTWLPIYSMDGLSQVVLEVNNPPANAGDIRDMGSIPGLARSPGGGYNNPLQYSCLQIPWTEKPGGQQSTGLLRVRHDWSNLTRMHCMNDFFKKQRFLVNIFPQKLNC